MKKLLRCRWRGHWCSCTQAVRVAPILSQPPSSLTVVPTAAPEGAAGELRQLTFRVTLTGPQLQPVFINYETVARHRHRG